MDEGRRSDRHIELLYTAEKVFGRLRPKFGGDNFEAAVEGSAAWALLTINEIEEVRALCAELSAFSKLWSELVDKADAELARRRVTP